MNADPETGRYHVAEITKCIPIITRLLAADVLGEGHDSTHHILGQRTSVH